MDLGTKVTQALRAKIVEGIEAKEDAALSTWAHARAALILRREAVSVALRWVASAKTIQVGVPGLAGAAGDFERRVQGRKTDCQEPQNVRQRSLSNVASDYLCVQETDVAHTRAALPLRALSFHEHHPLAVLCMLILHNFS